MLTNQIIACDTYSGNGKIPYKAMRDIHGVRVWIRKASMGRGLDNDLQRDVDAIRGIGGILGLYHWCDPTAASVMQGDIFLHAIQLYKPDFIAFDVEQAWPWGAAGTNFDYNTVLPAAKLFSSAAGIIEYVTSHAKLPYLIYTGKWYTDKFCPQLGKWIGAQPAWIASYPDYYFLYPPGVVARKQYHVWECTLLDPPAQSIPEYLARMKPEWLGVPDGVTNVKLWQITSRVIIPEYGASLDLSRWQGDEASFINFLDPNITFHDTGNITRI